MKLIASQEHMIYLASIVISLGISLLIIRKSWKQYGLLFLLTAAVGNILCYIFVSLEFYSFPVRLFPQISSMPISTISTAFPAYVLLGVYFSPKKWIWKIPFYWAFVHIGMLGETYAQNYTKIIKYNFKWDFWDSYTWWWIFLLLFEWVGGRIVSPANRRPIQAKSFYYGRWAWAVFHFIIIITIFLGGYYLGRISS